MQPFYTSSAPPIILGIVNLGLTRDYLYKNHVHDYNTHEALHTPATCTKYELKFRTYDGRCNNLEQPGKTVSVQSGTRERSHWVACTYCKGGGGR